MPEDRFLKWFSNECIVNDLDMRKPIIVLGMHRSGTSFLVRSLNLSGLWLGPDSSIFSVEGRGFPGNPKGNYEGMEIISINDHLLSSSGGAWYKPPQKLELPESASSRMRLVLHRIESTQPKNYITWGWKDPRTVLTLDAWKSVMKRDVSLVASFRHPHMVAASLFARDGIPMELGYSLWGYYNQYLLHHMERNDAILVRFDVDGPVLVTQVIRAIEWLGLLPDKDRILEWYDKNLVRSSKGDEHKYTALFNSVAHIWDDLIRKYNSQEQLVNSDA